MRSSTGGVAAGMASFGNRTRLLQRAVASIVDQVDRLGVYLNHYDDVPDFLRDRRIVVARSQDHGDLRDNGKFFFLDLNPHGFYAAVDDDIEYPPDYIGRLRATAVDAGPDSAVGVHGAVYPKEILGLSKPRRLFHYADSLPHVMPVHLLGTGTVLFDQEAWSLEPAEFEEPGMADVWFARSARHRGARLFAINRSKDWLLDIPADENPGSAIRSPRLFAEARIDDSRHVEILSSADISGGGLEGLIDSLLASEEFAQDLTLTQALLLDELRREMGWPRLGQEPARVAGERILSARRRWDLERLDTGRVAQSHTELAVGILSGDLTAPVVLAALDTLQTAAATATSNPDLWKRLPYAIRFDTRPSRLDQIRATVLRLSSQRHPDNARKLWTVAARTGVSDLQFALRAEEGGLDTGFQQLPALRREASKSWLRAATALRQYFELREFTVPVEPLGWRRAFGEHFDREEIQLLLMWIALRSGETGLGRRVLDALRHSHPAEFDTWMAQAALEAATAGDALSRLRATLDPLDTTLGRLGLPGFTRFLDHSPAQAAHWSALLTAPTATVEPHGPVPTVTVIMSAFNSADTIRSAASSVLASRAVDLQLILVDDHSADGTSDVIESLDDGRMIRMRNETNLGPYVSRNRALRVAEGQFVTIADADDWSHPDRIRFQVDRLKSQPPLLGCTVAHVRLLPDGSPDLENNLRYLGHGPVSLMFDRAVIDHVGGFDHVRTRGDVEFIRRLEARFGASSIARFEVPLILASSSPASNSKRFDEEALGRYRQASREWHTDNAHTDALYVSYTGGRRAGFVAPAELLVATPDMRPGPVDAS